MKSDLPFRRGFFDAGFSEVDIEAAGRMLRHDE